MSRGTAAGSSERWYFPVKGPLPEADGPNHALVERYLGRWLLFCRSHLPAVPQYAALCGAAERGDGLRETDSRQIASDLNRSRVNAIDIADDDVSLHLSLIHI